MTRALVWGQSLEGGVAYVKAPSPSPSELAHPKTPRGRGHYHAQSHGSWSIGARLCGPSYSSTRCCAGLGLKALQLASSSRPSHAAVPEQQTTLARLISRHTLIDQLSCAHPLLQGFILIEVEAEDFAIVHTAPDIIFGAVHEPTLPVLPPPRLCITRSSNI